MPLQKEVPREELGATSLTPFPQRPKSGHNTVLLRLSFCQFILRELFVSLDMGGLNGLKQAHPGSAEKKTMRITEIGAEHA